MALTPAFAPDHECSLHGDPWGLLALAASAPAALTPTAATEARASESSYSSTAAASRAASAYDGEALPTAEQSRATRVEAGRDGRRTLTNDLSVVPAAKE